MKSYFSVTTYLLSLIVGGFMALSACTEEESPDPKLDNNPKDSTTVDAGDKDDPEETIDANEISNSLMLENASASNGSIPAPSGIADLKLDKDTLFFVEGFKNRIRILYPPNSGFAMGSSSVYIQVEGADQYYDVKLDEEESSDTVGVLYIEFDPGDWDLPFSFKIKIAPHEDNGSLIDEFEKEVVIEKKGDFSCSPTQPYPNWSWIYTIRDGEIETAPGFGPKVDTQVTGCCSNNGESVDCIEHFIPEAEWKKLTGSSHYIIDYETLIFDESGIRGELLENVQNLDPSPENSNFCSGDLAYITRHKVNTFWGDYTYNPSNARVQFTNLESTVRQIDLGDLGIYPEYDKMFIRTEFLYEIISCNFLMETSSVEGSSTIRLFERKKDPKAWIAWFD